MISAAGLGFNPFQKARMLALRQQQLPQKVGFLKLRPALAPPPPPPPPAPPPAWAQRWAAFRQQQPRPLTAQEIADIQRNPQTRTGAGHFVALPPPPPPPPPNRRTGAALFGYVDDFGRPVRARPVRPARPMRVARRPMPMPRYLFPRSTAAPTIIYMQPLPGCTVSPNPIPPCSGTLTWVDSRTVCCR